VWNFLLEDWKITLEWILRQDTKEEGGGMKKIAVFALVSGFTSPCECGNESLGSINCWETIDWLHNWWPLE
jgi:hypothetical protein